MMCPKCHHLMVRKSDGDDIYYFECETCGNTIGKPSAETVTEPVVTEIETVKETA